MDNKNNNRKGPGGNRQGWGIIMFTTLLAVFVVMGLYSLMQDKNPEEISYDKFIEMVDKGEVDASAETSGCESEIQSGDSGYGVVPDL